MKKQMLYYNNNFVNPKRQPETFAKPQNNSLVLGVSLFQHKHNKIKQNNHTNLTITAHFQAALCPFRQQSAQQALTCLLL